MRILEKCNRTTQFFCTSVALFYLRATEQHDSSALLLHFSTCAQQSTRFSSIFCCTFLLACNRAPRFLSTSVALFYSHATEHHDFSALLLHFSTCAQQNNTIPLHFCCTFLLARNRTTRFFCTSVASIWKAIVSPS